MPQMGESIVEGTITKWLKKVGDHVEKDEPLFEISTDKVDAEIPSPIAGILTEIKVPEGATVEINTVVAVIGGVIGAATHRSPSPSSREPRRPSPRATPLQSAAARSPRRPPLRSSPLVRRIAKENNLDLEPHPRLRLRTAASPKTTFSATSASMAPAAPQRSTRAANRSRRRRSPATSSP